MSEKCSIKEFLTNKIVFEDIDRQLAFMVRRLCPDADESLLLGAALASKEIRSGHVCLDIADTVNSFIEFCTSLELPAENIPELPSTDEWCDILTDSTCIEAINTDSESNSRRPLFFDLENKLLYLNRYSSYENHIAENLRRKAEAEKELSFSEDCTAYLEKLFPGAEKGVLNRQALAAAVSALKNFTVISGGPGTGKTYTAARILALLIALNENKKPLRIKLAAPTGKAAMRLEESIKDACRELAESKVISEAILNQIPDKVSTLDRLLGYKQQSAFFRHDITNKLAADLILIDEAGMIDLPRMAKLTYALEDSTKLILLGDMNQLSSVEAGFVFGDICRAAEPGAFTKSFKTALDQAGINTAEDNLIWDAKTKLCDCTIELDISRRFPSESTIAQLSSAIKLSDSDKAWEILNNSDSTIRPHSENEIFTSFTNFTIGRQGTFGKTVCSGFKKYLEAKTPHEALAALKDFRVLCAVRKGPFGVESVNNLIKSLLFNSITGIFYHKRVIMISRNDYPMRLFNGDMGVIFTEGTGNAAAYFEESNTEGEKSIRKIPVNMLPEHTTAFAITIHKSQGSEFEKLALILPENDNKILTRELIYTGLTRTKTEADIWCTKNIFKKAVTRKTVRASGLQHKIL